ncbi:unnamed protein product [Brassicogethes aeneus]|uniref:Trans-1,2-dihydrobenzene-1,2-diol dehydrogenase n=1 Tax=Brassicogethes aeneus TaxID=1431903 RepID=A0A9P0BGU1_BRAAE|nr:unnamed protein product [Brassicogethes aeneus]
MSLKWGIAGSGKISSDFVTASQSLPKEHHEVVAVAARSQSSADSFAKKFNLKKSYEGYAQLAKDEEVEVVYIGVLNPQHYEVAKLMLESGKHVLCEKPFTMNQKQTSALLKLAKEKNLFIMEAIWSRCFPVYKELSRLLEEKTIGDVYSVSVEFGFPLQEVDRLTQKEMGGGSILDLGIYTLQFQQFVYRGLTPNKVVAAGHLNSFGTDQSFNAILTYPEGKTAMVGATAMVEAPNEGIIVGTKGTIRIPGFWCPTTLILNGKEMVFPLPENKGTFNFNNSVGLSYEAEEVRQCIRGKQIESELVPHSETMELSKLMDNIRKQFKSMEFVLVVINLFFILILHVLSLPLTSDDVDIFSDKIVNNVIEDSFNITNSTRLARVLNFFPVPVEEECRANDGRRKGVCMNTYECRIQNGKSYGPCALGFGVCCVFTATCNQEAYNNLTYFVNPDFPDLTHQMTSCSLIVKKIDPEIAQLRLDFIHFNLGQPNRKNGVCEEDIFLMTGGKTKELKLCGLNSGQHAYYDVEDINEPITISMNLSRRAVSRLWEVRITQVPFAERAPAGCLQYHTGLKGVIQTMNFADNGRHLAEQDYNICMRQEEGMCSIAYEPCHEDSFKIDPNRQEVESNLDDALEGSGSDGVPQSRQMDSCGDMISLPCDSDDLIMPMDAGGTLPGFCNLIHCGPSLCPSGQTPCRVESSSTPFTVGVHFGPSAREAPPDDNLGMCLVYDQLPCNV